MRGLLSIGSIAVLLLFGALQLVPYGRDHTNPPVLAEPAWDSLTTRQLAQKACFDCHSNLTTWPWYSNIAPMSWLVYRDVRQGRHELNFSEWGRGEQEGEDAAESVVKRTMPPALYLPLHPEANLTDPDRRLLATGLTTSLGSGAGRDRQAEGDGREEKEDDD